MLEERWKWLRVKEGWEGCWTLLELYRIWGLWGFLTGWREIAIGCRGRGRIGLVEGGWRKRVSIHLSPSPSSLLQWLPTLTHLRQPCPCSSSSPKSTSAQCRTLFIWQWPGTWHFFTLFLTCTIYHSNSLHWSTSDLSSFTPHTCWTWGLLLIWGINTYTVVS